MATDNTEKEKGFVYQALYALKIFFENSNNTDYIIGYETNGDVTLWNGSTPLKYFEIKHHKKSGNLTESSNDFWKTIKNMYCDYVDDEEPTFENYIFVTTEKDTFFKNKSDKEKLEFIVNKKNQKKENYFDIDFCEKKLSELVGKIKICDEQSTLKNLQKELFKYIKLIEKDENKEMFLNSLSSEIDKGTIFSNPQNRIISFEKLDEQIVILSKPYTGNKLKLREPEEQFKLDNCEEKYIDELKSIQIKSDEIINGVRTDYLFTMYNKIEKLTTPIIIEMVNRYEENINNKLSEKKAEHKIKNITELNNYFDTINYIGQTDIEIKGVETKSIFHRGTAHYLVNEERHSWKYEDENE